MPAVRHTVREDGVAILTLDRPESKVNILDDALWDDLEATLDRLRITGNILGLVLASAKPDVFIAGADLKVLQSVATPGDPSVKGYIDRGLAVMAKFEALPFATCAAIDGAALGGGLEVALACDYRVASTNPKVKMGLPEVTLGLIPGWGGTQRLPRIIGLEDAIAMVVTGRADSGANASVTGLADRLVEPAELEQESVSLVLSRHAMHVRRKKTELLTDSDFTASMTGKSIAAREAERVMIEGATLPLAAGIALESEAFLKLAGSPESRTLINAFFERRKK